MIISQNTLAISCIEEPEKFVSDSQRGSDHQVENRWCVLLSRAVTNIILHKHAV